MLCDGPVVRVIDGQIILPVPESGIMLHEILQLCALAGDLPQLQLHLMMGARVEDGFLDFAAASIVAALEDLLAVFEVLPGRLVDRIELLLRLFQVIKYLLRQVLGDRLRWLLRPQFVEPNLRALLLIFILELILVLGGARGRISLL